MVNSIPVVWPFWQNWCQHKKTIIFLTPAVQNTLKMNRKKKKKVRLKKKKRKPASSGFVLSNLYWMLSVRPCEDRLPRLWQPWTIWWRHHQVHQTNINSECAVLSVRRRDPCSTCKIQKYLGRLQKLTSPQDALKGKYFLNYFWCCLAERLIKALSAALLRNTRGCCLLFTQSGNPIQTC